MTAAGSRSSADGTPPNRRLRLLEARLSAAPTPVTPNTPPLMNGLSDDSVRSFSSDASHATTSALQPTQLQPNVTPSNTRKSTPSTLKRRRPSPAKKLTTRVDAYFKPISKPDSNPNNKNNNNTNEITIPTAVHAPMVPLTVAQNGPPQQDPYRHLRSMVDSLQTENKRLNVVANEANDQLEEIKRENEDLNARIEIEIPELYSSAEEAQKKFNNLNQRVEKLTNVLQQSVIDAARFERNEKRVKMEDDSKRLGHPEFERTGTSYREIWVYCREWENLEEKLENIVREKETIEKQKKSLSKRKGKENDDSTDSENKQRQEIEDQEETLKVRLQVLKKIEVGLHESRGRMARDRDLLIREMRRQTYERQSAFSDFRVLHDRYQLLNLLGKGGYSEVYKAFDLQQAEFVACKIHQLVSGWSEQRKKSFIKHAMREYDIHKSLNHPRVVGLVDIFEIDNNTFCTVLQYCDGCDLDSYLRAHRNLSEREAKSIILQIFSGLQYLAEQRRRIIHYDLKPGNILISKGEVMIADFGLSKIMNESESTVDGMELTSQGAGTMWYLPPECFETGKEARISVKVDVWSAGVILYQMLYGRKPFGHDQSQEKMFREKTVKHQQLEFPTRPSVSTNAKDFMTKCLTRDAASRPDARQVLSHPFLRKK